MQHRRHIISPDTYEWAVTQLLFDDQGQAVGLFAKAHRLSVQINRGQIHRRPQIAMTHHSWPRIAPSRLTLPACRPAMRIPPGRMTLSSVLRLCSTWVTRVKPATLSAVEPSCNDNC